MSQLAVVVVAAGKGSRMQTEESKQYLDLNGKPIVVHTLSVFQQLKQVNSIVLVTGRDDVERCLGYVKQYGLSKVRTVVAGGQERQESVYKGLLTLTAETEWVLVHDGVRPFTAKEHVIACWHKAMETGAAVLAVPVKDTIKVVDTKGTIQSTPDRRSLWAIQTPQAFRCSLLLQAHEQAIQTGFVATDDAMLVEQLGINVQVVEADYYNIKITTPEDLPWANWIIHNVRGANEQ